MLKAREEMWSMPVDCTELTGIRRKSVRERSQKNHSRKAFDGRVSPPKAPQFMNTMKLYKPIGKKLSFVTDDEAVAKSGVQKSDNLFDLVPLTKSNCVEDVNEIIIYVS